MWDFKECRDAIQQKTWSHAEAVEMEKNYVQETEKLRERGDTYALMKCAQEPAVYGRDLRRYVEVETNGNKMINGDASDFMSGSDSSHSVGHTSRRRNMNDSAV